MNDLFNKIEALENDSLVTEQLLSFIKCTLQQNKHALFAICL